MTGLRLISACLSGIPAAGGCGDLRKLEGLHVVANLNRCRGGARELTDAGALRRFCTESVVRSGLTVVGEIFHQFDGGGVTGALVLAESHLAIHTWPEIMCVAVDVFVCNYTQDNSAKAHQVVDDLMGLFLPEDYVRHDVSSGGCTITKAPLRA